MSSLKVYGAFAPDPRTAAIKGRRYAYQAGFIGLRVISVEVMPRNPNYKRLLAHIHYYRVTIEASERRIPDHGSLDHGYNSLIWSWWDGAVDLCKGVNVRTGVIGADYADGRRHEMPVGSVGVVVKRIRPYVRVSFPEVPGHSFLYAHEDVEQLL
jgi:hypothetical protein